MQLVKQQRRNQRTERGPHNTPLRDRRRGRVPRAFTEGCPASGDPQGTRRGPNAASASVLTGLIEASLSDDSTSFNRQVRQESGE